MIVGDGTPPPPFKIISNVSFLSIVHVFITLIRLYFTKQSTSGVFWGFFFGGGGSVFYGFFMSRRFMVVHKKPRDFEYIKKTQNTLLTNGSKISCKAWAKDKLPSMLRSPPLPDTLFIEYEISKNYVHGCFVTMTERSAFMGK